MMAGSNTKRLEGRIALITGASRGIGRAVALRFAAEGAHLILTARTQGALEELDDEIQKINGGVPSTLVPGDITNYDMIDQMGAAIFERFGKLDILVGNAGLLGQLSPLGHIEPKTWDQVMAVNLTANWRLIRSFDSLLRQSEAGRVIFVTSSVGHVPRAYWGTYAISKAGLEMLSNIYAEETKKSNVRVNLINPGGTRTAMRAEAMPGENPESVKPPEAITEYFVELGEVNCARHGELIEP